MASEQSGPETSVLRARPWVLSSCDLRLPTLRLVNRLWRRMNPLNSRPLVSIRGSFQGRSARRALSRLFSRNDRFFGFGDRRIPFPTFVLQLNRFERDHRVVRV
jgi:hypothetical protein